MVSALCGPAAITFNDAVRVANSGIAPPGIWAEVKSSRVGGAGDGYRVRHPPGGRASVYVATALVRVGLLAQIAGCAGPSLGDPRMLLALSRRLCTSP